MSAKNPSMRSLASASANALFAEAYRLREKNDALRAQNAALHAALEAFDAWYDRAATLPVEPNEYAELKAAVRLARAALQQSAPQGEGK